MDLLGSENYHLNIIVAGAATCKKAGAEFHQLPQQFLGANVPDS